MVGAVDITVHREHVPESMVCRPLCVVENNLRLPDNSSPHDECTRVEGHAALIYRRRLAAQTPCRRATVRPRSAAREALLSPRYLEPQRSALTLFSVVDHSAYQALVRDYLD